MALEKAVEILSRAHRESDITEAGLALPYLDQVAAQLDSLTLERDRLREALRKHGEHMSSCASWDEADLMPACTCGLDAALAAWTEPT